MPTLIAYATRYGCAEKCARMLSEKIKGETTLCDLSKEKNVDLTPYDAVILGGSMYMGRILAQIPAFCRKYYDTLTRKKLGLYICAMAEGEDRQKELAASFPEELRAKALAVECLGGECIIDTLKPFHKFIFTKVAKTTEDKSTLSEEAIESFADAMNRG